MGQPETCGLSAGPADLGGSDASKIRVTSGAGGPGQYAPILFLK